MPSPLRDPKSLPDWIELDYYERPRKLRRLRRWLTWSCLLIGAALMVVTYWLGKQSLYEAGPVSTAHAMFNEDCGKCHTSAFQTAWRFWPAYADKRSVKDETCKQCHDGPPHNEQASDPACSSCHQEHRGRPVLAQVADTYCTACHAELHRNDGGRTLENVGGFAAGHPEFALWRTSPEPRDAGQIYFNHQVHLTERGVRGPGRELIKLECAACHQLDATRRYMLPINYDRHCAACHPLSVQAASAGPTEEVRRADEQFRRQPAPHPRHGAEEVRAALRDRLTEFVRRYPAVLNASSATLSDRVIPGKPHTTPSPDEQVWVQQRLGENERILFGGLGGCGYCHVKPEKATGDAGTDLPRYLSTQIPERWFAKSRFRHDSHRMLGCAECHAAAASTRTSDALMPRIDSCRHCHSGRADGARSNCVECHGYHDRTHEAAPSGRMTISDCTGAPRRAVLKWLE
jgi:hypothetical protein